MLTNEQYKSYVGQYVKRFYAPFNHEFIFVITDFRVDENHIPKFLYSNGDGGFWTDCEDSCIITNETPIKDLGWVANVNHQDYSGYNPFTQNQ